jgi:hypothetical protein
MLTAPELVITERIELLDQIEIAAELQHRVLADRMVRGKESTEFKASHSNSSGPFFLNVWIPNYGVGKVKAIGTLRCHASLLRVKFSHFDRIYSALPFG